MNILTVFTCHNRREKTRNCIRSLAEGNPGCRFTFIAVDDGSTDGTGELLEELRAEYDIRILKGNGSLFYSGGMRTGMEYALRHVPSGPDCLLLVNDDVRFFAHCIEKMAEQSLEQGNAVIVGAMRDSLHHTSYSAVKYVRGIRYRKLDPQERSIPADTFNANAVLIPYEAFRKTGAMDSRYVHSLGDFDYGLALKRAGYAIHVSGEYAGICENNPTAGGWQDTSLTIRERIRKKEDVKGAPTGPWFYFLKKNFGLVTAVRGCVTPFVRILIRK